MSEFTNEFKKKAGSLLLKLKRGEHGMSEEEWSIAKFLSDKGLAKYVGPEQAPKIMSITEAHNQMMLSALAHYQLSGLGEEFVQRHSEEQLTTGRFLFPGELPWHDRWPWKLLLPAIVSLVVSIIVNVVAYFLKK
jgi:hypothetical protein